MIVEVIKPIHRLNCATWYVLFVPQSLNTDNARMTIIYSDLPRRSSQYHRHVSHSSIVLASVSVLSPGKLSICIIENNEYLIKVSRHM